MIREGRPLTVDTYVTLNWRDSEDEFDPEDRELLDALRVLEKAT